MLQSCAAKSVIISELEQYCRHARLTDDWKNSWQSMQEAGVWEIYSDGKVMPKSRMGLCTVIGKKDVQLKIDLHKILTKESLITFSF